MNTDFHSTTINNSNSIGQDDDKKSQNWIQEADFAFNFYKTHQRLPNQDDVNQHTGTEYFDKYNNVVQWLEIQKGRLSIIDKDQKKVSKIEPQQVLILLLMDFRFNVIDEIKELTNDICQFADVNNRMPDCQHDDRNLITFYQKVKELDKNIHTKSDKMDYVSKFIYDSKYNDGKESFYDIVVRHNCWYNSELINKCHEETNISPNIIEKNLDAYGRSMIVRMIQFMKYYEQEFGVKITKFNKELIDSAKKQNKDLTDQMKNYYNQCMKWLQEVKKHKDNLQHPYHRVYANAFKAITDYGIDMSSTLENNTDKWSKKISTINNEHDKLHQIDVEKSMDKEDIEYKELYSNFKKHAQEFKSFLKSYRSKCNQHDEKFITDLEKNKMNLIDSEMNGQLLLQIYADIDAEYNKLLSQIKNLYDYVHDHKSLPSKDMQNNEKQYALNWFLEKNTTVLDSTKELKFDNDDQRIYYEKINKILVDEAERRHKSPEMMCHYVQKDESHNEAQEIASESN